MTLVFATNNAHKVSEVNAVLRGFDLGEVKVVTMRDIGFEEELPETTGTIVGNSHQKATYLFEKTGKDCFSEDTGLEIDALNGEPGVDTAHYSGSRDADKNIALVLSKMGDTDKRTARFRTVITLIIKGEIHVFEGVCEGTIRREQSLGQQGFGYDPIFQPDGYDRVFAEMTDEEKGFISHRGIATRLLIDFLKYFK
jgi:XTP/dITP diphosphohydrolase